MKRLKRSSYSSSYPGIKSFIRSSRALQLGLFVGTVSVGACHTDGQLVMPEDTSENYELLGDLADTANPSEADLPSVGSRNLSFTDGWVDYHLELLLTSDTYAEAALEQAEALLAVADSVLLMHELSELAPDESLSAIQAELISALTEALQLVHPELSENDFLSLELVVDTFYEDEPLDGDPAEVN